MPAEQSCDVVLGLQYNERVGIIPVIDGHDDGISTAIESSSGHGSDTAERVPRGLSVPNPREDRITHLISKKPEPRERWLTPVRGLPFYSPKKIGNWTKYILLQGVCRDVVTQKSQCSIPRGLMSC
jgi:hypothetical protein